MWVMSEWSLGRWIVVVMSFQKIYSLYGLTHQIVEISGDITDAGQDRTRRQVNMVLLSFWSVRS